ncbi:MAG TPA: hypothetical protein VH477_15375 [Bryobacteraceae bacterium]
MAAVVLHSAENVLFALDTPAAVPVTPAEAYVKGWFVWQNAPEFELRLALDGTEVCAFTGLARPDVARHHQNNPAFKYSGFVARFSRPAIPSAAKLFVRTPEKEILLAEQIQVPVLEPSVSRPLPLPGGPLVSVVLSIPQGAHPYLVMRAIESLRRQTYARSEICLIGHRPAFLEDLDHIALHESAAQARGEFVLFLDYRDELAPTALEELAARLADDVDLVYADEQEIDFYGHPAGRFTKPAFDPEAFLSWNYVGKGAAIRRNLLGGAEGDSWAVLRDVVRSAGPARVRHLPNALYYSRKGDELVAPLARETPSSPPFTEPGVTVESGLFPGSFRLRRAVPAGIRIGVVLRPEDGAFQRAALAPLIDARQVTVYDATPAGVTEDVYIFINRPLDTVNHFFLDELAAQALREECGIVTGISLDRKGRILHSGLRRDTTGRLTDSFTGLSFRAADLPNELNVVRSVDAISDEFFAVRRGISPQLARTGDRSVLVTPYAVATFDIMSEESMSEEPPEEQSALDAASRLRQIASERNYLKRELASARETLAKLEASRCQDLKTRIRELEATLETERQIGRDLQNSASWKLTAPLRACLRLVRGK